MIARPDVDTLLAGPLGQWLAGQATLREAAKKQSANRLFWALLVVLPLAGAMWVLAPMEVETKFWFTLLPAGAAWWWSQGPKRKAIKQVKTGINEAIAASLGLSYECDIEPDGVFEKAKNFGLMPSYDRASFEDRWAGSFGAMPFSLHEAHLQERRGSGKNTRWVTVFQGPIMAFGFGRSFLGTTLVQRSGRYRKLFGGTKDSIVLDGLRLDYVDMVHPGFEDVFDVFSDDQVEARYLVHPVYIERLVALEQSFAGKNIRALFSAGELVVAVENENMFESGSIEARDDRALIERTIGQFARMTDLADALNERPR